MVQAPSLSGHRRFLPPAAEADSRAPPEALLAALKEGGPLRAGEPSQAPQECFRPILSWGVEVGEPQVSAGDDKSMSAAGRGPPNLQEHRPTQVKQSPFLGPLKKTVGSWQSWSIPSPNPLCLLNAKGVRVGEGAEARRTSPTV